VPKPVAVAEPRTRLQHRRAEEARAKVAAKAAPKAYTGPLQLASAVGYCGGWLQ
jgi:hypothetical protein